MYPIESYYGMIGSECRLWMIAGDMLKYSLDIMPMHGDAYQVNV